MKVEYAPGVGDRIRHVRQMVPHRNTEAFGSVIDVSGAAVRLWQSGKGVPSYDNLRLISDKFGVSLDWLAHGTGEPPRGIDMASSPHESPFHGGAAMTNTMETLDVLATRSGGGPYMYLATNAVIEKIPMPSILIGRTNAKGIFVSNNAMAPAFRYGDTAWVDPILPPAEDHEVVIFGPEDGEEQKIIIATLVSFDESKWMVETLKPEHRQFELDRKDWPTCQRIVGKNARR